MTKIQRLKKEARQAAESHGHKLGKFKSALAHFAQCTKCNAYVTITMDLRPRGREICGTALILECGRNVPLAGSKEAQSLLWKHYRSNSQT